MQPPPLSDVVRHNIVRRLAFIFAASILAQFGAYAAFVYCLSAAAELLPDAARVTASAIVLVLRVGITMPLGFYAARFTYRAMRRAVPPAANMAAQPAIVASAVAAGVMILSNVATAPVTWLTIVRDLLAAALWIFCAQRALRRPA
jgi:hypothetical protein